MNAPRLEIDLKKIHHNAKTLVERLALKGIAVTGVSKAALGAPELASVLMKAGVSGIGDSRIENIEAMRRSGISSHMTLIRSPMLSQVDRVVASTDVSLNTELEVIKGLSNASQKAGLVHGIVLMVEMGDLREGIMLRNVDDSVREILDLPNIVIKGIGTNLACRSGVSPDDENMAELSRIACKTEAGFGLKLDVISGGNSANLQWALGGSDTGRINNLRLGESILLGRDPLNRKQIRGLFTDAITLIAEIIESKTKPSLPWGKIGQTAFGPAVPASDRGDIQQAILAIGHQDTDPGGLSPPELLEIIGSSSDHLVVGCKQSFVSVGTEMTFQLNYSALVRSMTSPFVAKHYLPIE